MWGIAFVKTNQKVLFLALKFRITSYNVCYTKLLRITTNGPDISVYYDLANNSNPDKFVLKGKAALGAEFYIPSHVITSYSIHYTKLYDMKSD